jgi:hypothetical protein
VIPAKNTGASAQPRLPVSPWALKGVPQAWRRDSLVQDGEIHRMEGAVAQPGKHGHDHQRRVPVCVRPDKTGRDEKAEGAEQRRTRPDPVHDEAGRRLSGAGNHEKHGHQETQLGET